MKKFLIAALFLINTSSFAMETSQTTPPKLITSPAEKKSNVKVGTFFEVPSNDILLSVGEGRGSLAAKDKRIEFMPSATSSWGLLLSYYDFDFKYKTLIFNEDSSRVQKYGKSNYNEYNVKYHLGFIKIKYFYQETKGFYADLNSRSGTTIQSDNDTSSLAEDQPINQTEDIVIRSDLKAKNWGFNIAFDYPIYYNKEPVKLIEATQSDRSEAELANFDIGFHFLSALDYSNFILEGKDYLIPESKQESFGKDFSSLVGVGYQRLGLDVGFLVNWYIGKSFTLFLSGQGGPGLQRSENIFHGKREFNYTTAQHMNLDFGVKYISNKHALKTSFEIDSWGSQLEGGNLDVQKTTFLFNYIYSI
jgi:hypothetical protein